MRTGVSGRAKLGDVVASLTVFDLVHAPRGLEATVDDAVIHDPTDPRDADEGSIVLAVGVDPSSSEAVELAAVRCAAVALKFVDGPPPALLVAADSSGTALLSVPREMTWGQAHSLVQTAVASSSTAERGVGGVPLGDLFSLANAVADMVGGAVTIEDVRSVVLAYSSPHEGVDEPRRQTILGRRVPSEWLDRLESAGVFRRLWAGEVVRYDAGPGFALRPRLAVAVRAGDAILGSIWVAEGAVPFGDAAADALRGAARIAALHLIRNRASMSLERVTRAESLRSVLDGTASADAAAYQLGVSPGDRFAVIAFEPRSSDEVDVAVQRERTSDLVALYCEAFRHHSAQLQLGRTTYVLLPRPDREEQLLAFAREIVARARASARVSLRAGVGPIVEHLREIPRSRAEADRVLRVLASEVSGDDVADAFGVQDSMMLVELRDLFEQRPHLRSRCVEALTVHDRRHRTAYVETLRAFLDAFGDVAAAAEALNVHPNTLRYRLRRLCEIGGLDLSDARQRLVAELDLRLTRR